MTNTFLAFFGGGLSIISSALTTGPWTDPSPQLSSVAATTIWGGSLDCWCGNDVLTFVFPEGMRGKKRGRSDPDGLWRKHARAMAFSDAWTWAAGKVSLFFSCSAHFASNVRSNKKLDANTFSNLLIKPLIGLNQLFFCLLDHRSLEDLGNHIPPLPFSKSAIFLSFLLYVGSICLPLPLCAPCFSIAHTKPALSAELLGCEDGLRGQSPGMPLKCCERARACVCVSQTLVFWPALTYLRSPCWAPRQDLDGSQFWTLTRWIYSSVIAKKSDQICLSYINVSGQAE